MKIFLKFIADKLRPYAPPVIAWEGVCRCCKGRVWSTSTPDDPNNRECIGCAAGITDAGKRRIEDRRQIDLYKLAIREIELEKAEAAKSFREGK